MTGLPYHAKETDRCYEFRYLEKVHLPGVAELLRRVLSADVDGSSLEWKYFENPAGGAVSVVILHEEKVVGILAALPSRVSVAQSEVLAVEEVDLAISEEHRRLDVYLQMLAPYARRMDEGEFAFIYAVTSAVSSKINNLIKVKGDIGRIPRLVRVLNAAPFLKKKLSCGQLAVILAPIVNLALELRFFSRAGVPEGTRIKRIIRFDDRFDELWKKTRRDYRVVAVRDATYLNWRYAENPRADYEMACLERTDSGEIEGYVIAAVKEEKDLRRGQIMDIVAPKERGWAAKALLHHAMDYFRQRHVDAVECWMSPHGACHSELLRAGFTPRQKEFLCLNFQELNGAKPETGQEVLRDRESWYISLGDSDLG